MAFVHAHTSVPEAGLVSLGAGLRQNIARRPGRGPPPACSGPGAGGSPPGRQGGELGPNLVLGAQV